MGFGIEYAINPNQTKVNDKYQYLKPFNCVQTNEF